MDSSKLPKSESFSTKTNVDTNWPQIGPKKYFSFRSFFLVEKKKFVLFAGKGAITEKKSF